MPDIGKMPIANQAAADRASAASQVRMQASTKQSSGSAMMSGPAVAQQAAATQAVEQGGIAAQAKAADIQQTATQAHKTLADNSRRDAESQVIHQEAMQKRHTEQVAKLESYGRDVKKKLYDDAMQMNKTERGVEFRDERNLADYMRLVAQDQQELADYEQQVHAAMQEEAIIMEGALASVMNAIEAQFNNEQNQLDDQMKARLEEAQEFFEAELEKSKKNARKQGKMMGTMKMAVGAGAMYVSGGTVGGSMVAQGANEAGHINDEQAAVAGAAATIYGGL